MIKPGRILHHCYFVPMNLLPSVADGLSTYGIDVVCASPVGSARSSQIERPGQNAIELVLLVLVRAENVAPDFVFPEDLDEIVENGK